jgi:hypothetical protein
MAKTINLTSPIKVITSGTAPTTTNMKKGELAYGTVGGINRLYGNPAGTAIVEYSIPDAINSVSYNSTTAALSFRSPAGTTTINLPKENFLSNASYSASTKKLTLTLTDNSTVEVSLSELVDTYIAASAGGLEVVSTNQFKIKAAGVVETMLASAVATKLNKTLSVSGGTAESNKYVSAIAVSDHAITVTKAALPVTSGTITDLKNSVDIYNVTREIPLAAGSFYTSATARAAVPAAIRKQGLIISYQTGSTAWVLEQYPVDDVAGWTSTSWLTLYPTALTAAASQTISIAGTAKGVTATINAAAVVTDGGLKVTSGKLELDTADIAVGLTVTEI